MYHILVKCGHITSAQKNIRIVFQNTIPTPDKEYFCPVGMRCFEKGH